MYTFKLLKFFVKLSLQLYILESDPERELVKEKELWFDKDLIILLQRELKDLANFLFISIVLVDQCLMTIKLSIKKSL